MLYQMEPALVSSLWPISACHTSCGTICLGPNSNQCLDCPVGLLLDLETQSCLTSCPIGDYEIIIPNHPFFNAEFKYCWNYEDGSLEIYVDSNSDGNI